MKQIIHASDLHFGKINPDLPAVLKEEIIRQRADMVIISGDFTQTGSEEEFAQAADFLNDLPCPAFCVPGNHDIPRKNLYQRFFHPLALYKKYISPNPCPVYSDEDMMIVGLNTARAAVPHWNWANGRISSEQIDYAREQFARANPCQHKILVCHHPVKNVDDVPIRTMLFGRRKLQKFLKEENISLLLTGHIHHAVLTYDKNEEAGLAMIGAATATSTRLRAQGNGYNLITMSPGMTTLTMMVWEAGKGFTPKERHQLFEK